MIGLDTARHVSTRNQGLSRSQHMRGAVHHVIRWNVGYFVGIWGNGRYLERQYLGTSTNDPSRSLTEPQPSRAMVRSRSALRMAIARATPTPPAAINPYAYARPTRHALAPMQRALSMAPPRRMPPSTNTGPWP